MNGAAAQQGTDDLDSYSSPKAGVAGNFQKPEELNKDKVRLDRQEEYVFELCDRKLLIAVAGFKAGEKVDKVLLTWKEVSSGNIIQNSFRIDNPVRNIKHPEFQSPVINFFDNVDWPLPTNPELIKAPGFWGSRFVKGMKIKARVQIGKDSEGTLIPGKYKIEPATVRKFSK